MRNRPAKHEREKKKKKKDNKNRPTIHHMLPGRTRVTHVNSSPWQRHDNNTQAKTKRGTRREREDGRELEAQKSLGEAEKGGERAKHQPGMQAPAKPRHRRISRTEKAGFRPPYMRPSPDHQGPSGSSARSLSAFCKPPGPTALTNDNAKKTQCHNDEGTANRPAQANPT